MSAFTSRMGWMGAGAALVLGSVLAVGQAGSAGAAPEEKKPAAFTGKLVKPWGELTTLSDEQKIKIHEIHRKALDQINEIEKQEKADIMAVLTDGQKNELKELAARDKKEAAEKRAAKKAGAAAPTTAPADKKG